MSDPLEELQAETARKLVVSLREELAVAKAALEKAREENVVLAEMVWDAAEFWWERARQLSHEMDTVSELEAMRIHAILSKLYDKVRGTALATHPGPQSQEQAVSHYPERPTPENVETSRAPRGRMEVYSERELLSDIREAGPLLDAHLEPVADPQPATPPEVK